MDGYKKMRTIAQMIKEIKIDDPGSCVTEYLIEFIINNQKIDFIRIGNRKFYDFDKVLRGLGLI